MKRLAFFLLFAAISSVSFAQIDIGPRIGLGTVFTNLEETSNNIESGDADYGFSIGLFTAIGSKNFKVMPEVLYSTRNTQINFQDENGVDQVAKSELNQIDVPINLKAKLIGPLSLQGGIIGSYLVESEDGFIEKTDEAIRNYEDFTFGFQAGAGLELGNFLVDLRYESNLSDLSSANNNDLGIEFDERQSMVKALLGIKLF